MSTFYRCFCCSKIVKTKDRATGIVKTEGIVEESASHGYFVDDYLTCDDCRNEFNKNIVAFLGLVKEKSTAEGDDR